MFFDSSKLILKQYNHRRRFRTIIRYRLLLRTLQMTGLLLMVLAGSRPGLADGGGSLPGFTPENQNLLSPILHLAPPGPDRNARSLQAFDRFLGFYPKIAFDFDLTPQLRQLIKKLPVRQSTLVRAASFYSRDDIPWSKLPPDIHYLAVRGQPQRAGGYLYSLAPSSSPPEGAGDFRGWFGLRPALPTDGAIPQSVIGDLGGELQLDAFGAPATVDLIAAVLREFYGDLAAPWDSQLGQFNQHDAAALRRLDRDTPALAAEVNRYFEFSNILDELPPPTTGPCKGDSPLVVFNLDARVRLQALHPFPHLASFYSRVAPIVSAQGSINDDRGDQWLDFDFDRGRIRMRFLVCSGALVAAKPAFADDRVVPTGDPAVLDQVTDGHYHSVSSARVHRFGMDFGMQNVDFETEYRREGDRVKIENRMRLPAEIVAPAGLRQLSQLLAGRFMDTLARGNAGHGVDARFSSTPIGTDGTLLTWETQAELFYSPTLEFLARIGDSIADAHNESVRDDERRLWQEIYGAIVSDYQRARPLLLQAAE
jgi:hypothetical protein